MIINNDGKEFFLKFAKVWQNFKDYSYLEGINLSPEQIKIIEDDEEQLLIEGYAGTGKSVTLLYKFINVLVREEKKKVLFVTYNSMLIEDTKKRLDTSNEYKENKDKHQVDIMTFHEVASKILKKVKVIDKGVGKLTVEKIKKYQGDALRRVAAILCQYTEKDKEKYRALPKEELLYKTHNNNFVTEEIAWIKAMGFTNKEKYLEIERTGRSKSIRLTRNQRKTIYKIYEEYQGSLESGKYGRVLDLEDYALNIVSNKHLITDEIKYDYIFVDEIQDLDPMQVMALCNLTKKYIVLSGDAKQRIYKKCPLKYEDLGLNINQKGRRKILNKNYRSTKEIVTLANSLKFYDSKGKFLERQFVKRGRRPIIHVTKGLEAAGKYIVDTINKIYSMDKTKSIAIIHREEIKGKTGLKSNFRLYLETNLKQSITDIYSYGKKFQYDKEKQIFYTNGYDVKGLEFDYVFIIDFNSEYYPSKKGIKKIREANEGKDKELVEEDILEFINTEKKLLYVSMTRAKEMLYLIANVEKGRNNISEFIYDFNYKDYEASGFTKRDIEESRELKNIFGYRRLFLDKEEIEQV
ncbi:UvrD-helicase domain-containing protein [Clostridium bornimense]|uniref:UvrD-helicase domain-containing protein n=1 Tax=Clostridium bornimense TaxID=1216932 RepID=UPI001C12496D|nr:UvrD-helicase domain-containing protein [Clostridium bornimense]MBU5316514.1 UvrD-helicase domain-containing protein [Clostridium bornimense]